MPVYWPRRHLRIFVDEFGWNSEHEALGWFYYVSRKKQAPKEYPVEPELAEILRAHRTELMRSQNPGLAKGLMFPSRTGTLRTPNSMDAAWADCLVTAKITKRFTVHGLRRTFTDLTRRVGVDAVVIRSMTGHVTERMRDHYSSVAIEEKRSAVAGVVQLVARGSGDAGGDGGKAVDREERNE